MKSKTIAAYHSADWDGVFCYQIAKRFLPIDTQFIGWNFGDEPLPIDPDAKYYIMDIPVDQIFGFNFAKGDIAQIATMNWLRRIIWIDHHASAIASHPAIIPGYRIDGVAACRLAWQFFSAQVDGRSLPITSAHYLARTVKEPLAVRLAGEYDVFYKEDPRAELFQSGLRSQPLQEIEWNALLGYCSGQISEDLIEALLSQGSFIDYARKQEYADVITSQGFDVEFEGVMFLACNSHECDIRSQLFEARLDPAKHDGMLGFTYTGKGLWRVSMYGAPWSDIDFSEIAKKHGGGGHKKACGFQCKELPFKL
jgi:hypothetical protein